MRLSDEEKQLIAGRAAGCYACIPKLKSILTTHGRKNRTPEDIIYLEFLQVAVGRKTLNWDDYEPLARQIIALYPDPFFTGERRSATKQRQKTSVCSLCNKSGHSARKCPTKEKQAIVIDEGIPRLSPGWDPSSDVEDPPEDTW